MKKILFLFLAFICFPSLAQKGTESLNKLIDAWHLAATNADFKAYFAPTTDDFIFLGTAPGERWTKKEFQTFSKPYFDKGKAWDFKASNRKWNFSKDGKTAWFDEDLKTWMEDCRGSGVCVKEKGEWKIAYYNLTVLIENEKIKEFIELRKQ
jgi:ketosteroid isomerase-like protein